MLLMLVWRSLLLCGVCRYRICYFGEYVVFGSGRKDCVFGLCVFYSFSYYFRLYFLFIKVKVKGEVVCYVIFCLVCVCYILDECKGFSCGFWGIVS